MFRHLCLLCACLFCARDIVPAQGTWFREPLSPRIANYVIEATLDDEARTVTGRETLLWRNVSGDRVHELWFHLYLNAFKNTETTFLRDGRSHRDITMAEGGWGWIDITSLATAGGDDLSGKIQFVQPDDGNASDQTVIRVPLAKAVGPGESITLKIGFTAKLPRVFARTGYFKDFFMVGQWFPKIGVYEAAGTRGALEGRWNCHQFHANTEFYSDFGVYDVKITVPDRMIVGATGTIQSETGNGNGTKTLAFHAEDVHDFAWTASPAYVDLQETWKHVRIRVLMQPQRRHQAERYFQSVKAALEYFERTVGPYPYPTLTIVDPAYGAMGAGGMEYPTLITAGSLWGVDERLRFAELVTVHEFGHQYWYGMSANNEFEEAWLDEGINQYYETRIMDATYGPQTSFMNFFGLQIGDFSMTRSTYASMANPRVAATATPAWKFPRGAYGVLTYNKSAVFLTTLEHLIGTATMDSVMRTFFRRWRFKHPSGRDFVRVFNEIVPAVHGMRFGSSLDWYFDQVLYGTGVCDYELTSITTRSVEAPEGVLDSAGTRVTHVEPARGDDAALVESRVRVSRLGEIQLPVSVLITFKNGEELRETWDGKAPTVTFTYRRKSGVRSAVVDPDNCIALDINTLNNTRSVAPNQAPIWKYTAKFLFWVQNLLHFFSI